MLKPVPQRQLGLHDLQRVSVNGESKGERAHMPVLNCMVRVLKLPSLLYMGAKWPAVM